MVDQRPVDGGRLSIIPAGQSRIKRVLQLPFERPVAHQKFIEVLRPEQPQMVLLPVDALYKEA